MVETRIYEQLLRILEKEFPVWANGESLLDDTDIAQEEDIINLAREGMIEVTDFKEVTNHGNYATIVPVPASKMGKGFSIENKNFRLSQKGFEYLNNVHIRNLNKILIWLTVGLFAIGISQLIVTILQFLK